MAYSTKKEVNSLVRTGLYENEEEVIADAVRALLEKKRN